MKYLKTWEFEEYLSKDDLSKDLKIQNVKEVNLKFLKFRIFIKKQNKSTIINQHRFEFIRSTTHHQWVESGISWVSAMSQESKLSLRLASHWLLQVTIGRKFRLRTISAPKRLHASAISLQCQWPLRNEKKKVKIGIYIYPLFELTDCMQSPDVDNGASSSDVIVCVIAPVCGLQNFMRHYLQWQHFF